MSRVFQFLLQYTCDAIYWLYVYPGDSLYIYILYGFCFGSAARFLRRQATRSLYPWIRLGGFWVVRIRDLLRLCIC